MVGRSPKQNDSTPSLKTFSCTNCGASVSIRYPGASLSVVCDSCQSVIDATDDLYRIVQAHHKATKHWTPRIALGSRGTLKGKEWEVIGFLVRTDSMSGFSWEEYLLFSPYYGYRWLTLNDNHWSFVYTVKEKPKESVAGVKLDGEEYKIYYRGKVYVSFVIGEFYWKVQVGNEVTMVDYICPPKMLSVEEDGTQRIWAVSDYLEPDVVYDTFEVANKPYVPTSVAPHQPARHMPLWKQMKPLFWIFFLLLIGLEIFRSSTCLSRVEFNDNYPYTTNTKTANITSKPFVLTKDIANVEIRVSTDVDNAWFYLYGELVNDNSGVTYPFESTIEYYHGYSGGEYWSEGGRNKTFYISSVPGGTYYLNFDTEHGDYPRKKGLDPKRFEVVVKRDIEPHANIFWAIVFIAIWPGIVWAKARSEEYSRWYNSDFSPYAAHHGGDYDY